MCSDGSEAGDDDGDMEEEHKYEYGDLEAASEDADASDMASTSSSPHMRTQHSRAAASAADAGETAEATEAADEADWKDGWHFAEVLPVLLVVLLRRIKRHVKHVSSHYIVFSGRGVIWNFILTESHLILTAPDLRNQRKIPHRTLVENSHRETSPYLQRLKPVDREASTLELVLADLARRRGEHAVPDGFQFRLSS